MSNDCTGGRSGYKNVQSPPCDGDPMSRKNNHGGARPGNSRNQQAKPKPGRGVNRVQIMRSDAGPASGAPVATSSDLQQYTRFSSAGGRLRMHTCAALAELCSEVVSGAPGAIASLETNVNSVQLSVTNPTSLDRNNEKSEFSFVSPIWQMISTVFVKYRVLKCIFHYMPQSTADEDARMVFAFAADPLHPLLWKKDTTSRELLALSDSIAFMPWKSWSMDVTSRLGGQEFYTFAFPETGPGQGSFVERFNDFGVMAAITSGVLGSGTVPKKSGVLYLESVIEFDEFCPISDERLTQPAPRPDVEEFSTLSVVTNGTSVTGVTTEIGTVDLSPTVVSGGANLQIPTGVWEWVSEKLQSATSTVDTVLSVASGWLISDGSELLRLVQTSGLAAGTYPLTLKYLGPTDSVLGRALRKHIKEVNSTAIAGFHQM